MGLAHWLQGIEPRNVLKTVGRGMVGSTGGPSSVQSPVSSFLTLISIISTYAEL